MTRFDALNELVAQLAATSRQLLAKRGRTSNSPSVRKEIWPLIALFGAAWVVVGAASHLGLVTVFASATACIGFVGWAGHGFLREGYNEGAIRATQDAEELARLAAMRLPCEADTAAWTGWPTAPDGLGHLYVIQFATGVVKVGQTNRPSRRVGEHRRDAWAFGVVITNLWISPAHAGYLDNETRLISFASRGTERARREYFHGADFADVARFAGTLAPRSS